MSGAGRTGRGAVRPVALLAVLRGLLVVHPAPDPVAELCVSRTQAGRTAPRLPARP